MVLVILHELGHFTAAKKCGMKVPEFGIWLPPKICNLWKDKQGTQFTLNWIPLWGFCSIEWEDPTDKKSFENPNTLFTAKLRKRLIVIFAWVAMNFLTAWIILVYLFWHGIEPISVSQVLEEEWSTSYLMAAPTFLTEKWLLTWEIKSRVSIISVDKDSYAENIWLQAKDVLIKIDDNYISYSDFFNFKSIWDRDNHTLTVQRWNEELILDFSCQNENCEFWFIPVEDYDVFIKFWLVWAIWAAFHEIWAERDLTMSVLWDLWRALVSFKWSEMKEALNSLSGPVGAVRIWGLMFESWWRSAYLAFAAIISLALAFFNILPIPALDWGRALWMILQKVSRIKPEKYFKYESYVNAFFFYLILLLWVVLIIKDLVVYRWVNIPFFG